MPPAAFESGKLAMTVQGSWTSKDFEANTDFKLGEDNEVAPMPKAKTQVVPNGGWSLGISSKFKHPKETWKFIKYVTSYEGMKTYVTITGDIPAYPVVSDAIKKLFEDIGIGRKNVEASAREAVEKINIGINEIQKP